MEDPYLGSEDIERGSDPRRQSEQEEDCDRPKPCNCRRRLIRQLLVGVVLDEDARGVQEPYGAK